MKIFSLILLFCIIIPFSLYAISVDELYQEAIANYENNDFESALTKFSNLEFQGIINADLFYNIGKMLGTNN
jgi:outer membrane protein assembly factor BamD (BamD/ComL family)